LVQGTTIVSAWLISPPMSSSGRTGPAIEP
jgi:hypothetical protein